MIRGEKIQTGRRKLGAFLGDSVKVGVNVTFMPGRKVWPGILIPPNSVVKRDVKEQASLEL